MFLKHSIVVLLFQIVVLIHQNVVQATPNTTPGTIPCTDLSKNRVIGFELLDGSNNPQTQIVVTNFNTPITIDLNDFANCDLNVRAILDTTVPPNCDINNVRCVTTTFGNTTRRDFVRPFTAFLAQDGTGLPIDRRPVSGSQILKACPYTEPNCMGTRPHCFQVPINVIGCHTPPVTAPVSIPTPIHVPVTAPITPPVTAPVTPPVTAPVKPPVAAPVLAPTPVDNDECTFTIGQAFGGKFALDVTITIKEISNGIEFTVTESDTDADGDLRGLFFDVSNSFPLGLPSAISGADVTSTQVSENNVINLGNGANMHGYGNKHYDVGVEIGGPGVGGDDIRTTEITVAWPGLKLSHLCGQAFGVRATSSGPSKIFGQSCSCPPSAPVAPVPISPVAPVPVTAPIRPPVTSPVAPPVTAPIRPPVTSPVAPPVTAPIRPPVTSPVAPPVTAPVTTPVTAPITQPVTAPITQPVTAPITQPVTAPITPPVTAPITPPVTSPIKPPVTAPVKPPVTSPVKPPVTAPVLAPTPVDNGECTFTIGQAFGGSFALDVTISIKEIANGMEFTVTESDTDSDGDLRGLFFDVSNTFPLGVISTISGADVNTLSTQVSENNVINLGNGANMQGNGNKQYDVGVEIGGPGVGGDDIRTTKITVAWPGLKLSHLCGQAFGVRVTSSGPIGSRNQSSKIYGHSCSCPN